MTLKVKAIYKIINDMGSINLNLNSDLAASIQIASNFAANVAVNFIVSPNDAPPGVSGFVFDTIGDEELVLDSDITDHYVEQNSAIQDHISLKPLQFTLHGYQGELVDLGGLPQNPILVSVLALLPLDNILPKWNAQDLQIYGDISLGNSQASKVLNQITSLASLIGNLSTNETRQQAAYNFFLNLRNNRQLCTIQTPYGLLTNMAVENIRSLQPGDTRFMSHFAITFKQIQVVSTAVTPSAASPNPAGSGNSQINQNNSNPGETSQFTNNSLPPNFPTVIQSGVTSSASGRIADMIVPPVEEGQTTGVNNIPNFNPPIPVSVPNVFPLNNPIFATMPSVTGGLLP